MPCTILEKCTSPASAVKRMKNRRRRGSQKRIMPLLPKKPRPRKKTICNTASASCMLSDTAWSRTMDRRLNGMKKQCRETIPLLLMRSAVCTAAVRAWSKTMKKPMNCIAWQRSIRKSQTPMPHMSLDGCAGTGSARLQTRQHQKHGTGGHIRGSS